MENQVRARALFKEYKQYWKTETRVVEKIEDSEDLSEDGGLLEPDVKYGYTLKSWVGFATYLADTPYKYNTVDNYVHAYATYVMHFSIHGLISITNIFIHVFSWSLKRKRMPISPFQYVEEFAKPFAHQLRDYYIQENRKNDLPRQKGRCSDRLWPCNSSWNAL